MSETLPDIVDHGLHAVFCGINPGRCAAAVGHHFHGNGNRFWKTMFMAGYTPVQLSPEDDSKLLEYGYGLTAAVPRPSRSADEVTTTELQLGLRDLETRIRRWRPRVIAFLGKPAWRVYTGAVQVRWGQQAVPFGQAEVWILPNPSGLNRHFSLAELVLAYRELRRYLEDTGAAPVRLSTS